MNKRFISSFFLILTLIFTKSVFAQNYIEGYIKDKTTKESLPGASIVVNGTSLGTASNFEGYYLLKGIPHGKQTIQISFIGYQRQTFEIDLSKDSNPKRNFFLVPDGYSLDDVVVTAQARGQMNAINTQLQAIEIKNVVSADKIQEIPDANAAESIGRLPGVSVNRSGGEGNKVVIRGLSPKYNKIQIDGVDLAATGSDDRSVDISMISPYSLDGIEVVKAITADMDAEAVGGSVNLKMKKAKKGLHGNFNMQGGYNGLNNKAGDFLANGMVSNRFFDNKIGLLFQANYEQRDRSSIQESHGWGNLANRNESDTTPLELNSDSYLRKNTKKVRGGATFVVDYKWNSGDLVFSNFGSMARTSNENFTRAAKENKELNYNGGVNFNDLMVYTNTLKLKQNFDFINFDFTLSHSYSGKNTPESYSWAGMPNQSYDSDPLIHRDKFEPNDLWQYVPQLHETDLYIKSFSFSKSRNDEHIWTQNANLKYDFAINNWLSGNIKIGEKIRYNKRVYDVTKSSIPIDINHVNWLNALNAIDSNLIQGGRMSYKWFMSSDTINNRFPEPDVDQLKEIAKILLPGDGYYSDTLHSKGIHVSNSRKNDYYGDELLLAAYIMSEINIGKKLKIIPGLRWEQNRTSYNGFRAKSNTFAETEISGFDTTINQTHTFLLPNFHVRYKPLEWFDVRFAYTQTLARPNFSKIYPKWTIGDESISNYNNPYLKPEKSENFDLYFSFHGNKLGLFTIGLYHKTLQDRIGAEYKRELRDSASARPGYGEHPDDYGLPYNTVGMYINPVVNSKYDATVKGIEIEWQSNFYWLPGLWKGLVLSANYTSGFSQTRYPLSMIDESKTYYDTIWVVPNIYYELSPHFIYKDTSYSDALVNQPKHIINLSFGYDYKGFSVRTSMLYQHQIFQGTAPYNNHRIDKMSYLRWDLNIKQDLTRWVKGLQVYANWNNITSASDDKYKRGGVKPRLTNTQIYSYTFDLGLRYKF